VYSIFGASVGMIEATRVPTETFITPLLTPPGLNPSTAPGVLNDPYLRPLSLKIADDN